MLEGTAPLFQGSFLSQGICFAGKVEFALQLGDLCFQFRDGGSESGKLLFDLGFGFPGCSEGGFLFGDLGIQRISPGFLGRQRSDLSV